MAPEHIFLIILGLLIVIGAVNSVRALQRRWVAAGGSVSGGLIRGIALITLGLFGAMATVSGMVTAFKSFGWGGLVFVFGACLFAALMIHNWFFTPPANKKRGQRRKQEHAEHPTPQPHPDEQKAEQPV